MFVYSVHQRAVPCRAAANGARSHSTKQLQIKTKLKLLARFKHIYLMYKPESRKEKRNSSRFISVGAGTVVVDDDVVIVFFYINAV